MWDVKCIKSSNERVKNVYRQNIPLQFDPEVESSFQKIVLKKTHSKPKQNMWRIHMSKNNVRIGWPFLMNEHSIKFVILKNAATWCMHGKLKLPGTEYTKTTFYILYTGEK